METKKTCTLAKLDQMSHIEKVNKAGDLVKIVEGTITKMYIAGKCADYAHKEGKKLQNKINKAAREDKVSKTETAKEIVKNFNEVEKKAYAFYLNTNTKKYDYKSFYNIVESFKDLTIRNKILNTDVGIKVIKNLCVKVPGHAKDKFNGGSYLHKIVYELEASAP